MNVPDDHRPGLPPPRFGLAGLMVAVTLLGGFFALLNYAGSHAAALAILFALAVIAHVVGNAMGTRLRQNGDTPPCDRPARNPAGRRDRPQAADFAPATKLRNRSALGRPIAWITVSGTVAGGLLGGFVFWRLVDRPADYAGVLCGALAAAVLGGIWTFVAASFLQVAGGAMWQALRDSNRQR
jgi:hypothetical protein